MANAWTVLRSAPNGNGDGTLPGPIAAFLKAGGGPSMRRGGESGAGPGGGHCCWLLPVLPPTE
eukprot:9358901-Alexandrium_andersonii.AAC.1